MALPFFAKRIDIAGIERLAEKGPLLLAVNHPNSFLDAVLLGAFMHNPVHYLARGDVFRKAWVRRILSELNMLPVYRIRDGKDKLGLNDLTFERSREVLMNNGILLVFVEGFCAHQTTLQLPLKKGAPRVIESCWRQGIPVRVLPVWLKYSSFSQYPKEISIDLGEIFHRFDGIDHLEPSFIWQKINEQTTARLMKLEGDSNARKENKSGGVLKSLLFLPAVMAAVLHAPLYLPLKSIIRAATKSNMHYDSILFAVMLVLYPTILAAAGLWLAGQTAWYFFFLPFAIFPILARCYVVWR